MGATFIKDRATMENMDESADARPYVAGSPLVRLLGSPGRTRIVEAVLGKRGTELTAAEVAKLAGVDRSTVSRNVDSLVETGLVERRETPAGVVYRADVDDPAVRALSDARRALFAALAENPELAKREPDRDPATEAYVDQAGLVRLFGAPGRTKMIAALLGKRGAELTGAEVADLAGIDRSTVGRNVEELQALGIVEQTREVGSAKLYRLVADHPVVVALQTARRELLGGVATGDSTDAVGEHETSGPGETPGYGDV